MLEDIPSREQVVHSSKVLSILGSVPYEKGFHFFKATGVYTGETATNLETFAMKLQVIDAESVKFHFQRNDFEKWIKGTIGDEELADTISRRGELPQLPVEDLRQELLAILHTRIAELRRMHRLSMEHSH